MTYDFDAMREELNAAAHVTSSTKADRDIARIHALATVALAESVAQLVAWNAPMRVTVSDADALARSQETASPYLTAERAPDPVERDWRMGDVVTFAAAEGAECHVEHVGIDQGGTFLSVIAPDGHEQKVWAEHATFIRHDSAEALDADFAEAANAGRKSDAFAAAKAKTKKSK